MIVLLSPDAPPTLTDADRLDRLHAESPGALADMRYDAMCRRSADDNHVWLSIERLRAAGQAQVDDPDFERKFDGMIDYARSKGWLDDDGTHVRAHVEAAG